MIFIFNLYIDKTQINFRLHLQLVRKGENMLESHLKIKIFKKNNFAVI